MKKINFCILLFVLVSCSTGTKKGGSSLNYLNGEHYKADVHSGVLPYSVSKVRKSTLISGKIYYIKDDFKYPLRLTKVLLMKNNSLVASLSSDNYGEFSLKERLSDGNYQLKIESEKFAGSKNITLKGFKVADVFLEATYKK